MERIAEVSARLLLACLMAAVFWLVLAMPGFVSEQNTMSHAMALEMLASR